MKRGFARASAALITLWVIGGCQNTRDARQPGADFRSDPCGSPIEPVTPGLTQRVYFEPVDAMVVVPQGWREEPLKKSDRHTHQVWLSPSGKTAYGVIRMRLPLPVGPETVLRMGVLPEMKRSEGEARLVSSTRDKRLPGLRFIAEGGQYLIRSNLMTRGWRAWVVYAGTLRDQDVQPAELEIAESAREQTEVGGRR